METTATSTFRRFLSLSRNFSQSSGSISEGFLWVFDSSIPSFIKRRQFGIEYSPSYAPLRRVLRSTGATYPTFAKRLVEWSVICYICILKPLAYSQIYNIDNGVLKRLCVDSLNPTFAVQSRLARATLKSRDCDAIEEIELCRLIHGFTAFADQLGPIQSNYGLNFSPNDAFLDLI